MELFTFVISLPQGKTSSIILSENSLLDTVGGSCESALDTPSESEKITVVVLGEFHSAPKPHKVTTFK